MHIYIINDRRSAAAAGHMPLVDRIKAGNTNANEILNIYIYMYVVVSYMLLCNKYVFCHFFYYFL